MTRLTLLDLLGVSAGWPRAYRNREAARWVVEPDPAKRNRAMQEAERARDLAARAKRARKAARLEALADKGAIERIELPDGLYRMKGKYVFSCRACGEDTEWHGPVLQFDPDSHANVCGRSERCLP